MKRKVIGNAILYCGDCEEVLSDLFHEDIDACVTDPPYGLSFMGKKWDYDVPNKEVWEKVYNALKPGAHLLSFFGSRTYHRGVIPIEDVGFDIRDQIMWLYGSGFPKSHNIGKAIDKKRGTNNIIRPWLKSLGSRNELAKAAEVTERQIDHYLGENTPCPQTLTYERFILICDYFKSYPEWSDDMFPKVGKKIGEKTHSRSGGKDYAKIVGSKSTTKKEDITQIATDEAKQWEGWGTALKPAHEPIVMARKPFEGTVVENVLKQGTGGINIDASRVEGVRSDGRFPANIIHDGSKEVIEGFPSVARFFYSAKTSKKEKGEGNNHPTVKPIALMKYLCKLVTPKDKIILDPFMGSGSTGLAALEEGFKFIGIEREEEYFDIACARLQHFVDNQKTNLEETFG